MWKTYGSGNQKNGIKELYEIFQNSIRCTLDDIICKDFTLDVMELMDSNGNLRNITQFFYRGDVECESKVKFIESPNVYIRPKKKPSRLPRILSEDQKEYIIKALNNTIRILNYWNKFPNIPEPEKSEIKKDLIKAITLANRQIEYITQL